MSTGHDTSDFNVVAANRELKQRLIQAEHTAALLRKDLVSMTKVADQQYLSWQEAEKKFKWATIVIQHLQAANPMPDGWRVFSIEALIRHVFKYQTDARKKAQKEIEGTRDEHEQPRAAGLADSGGIDSAAGPAAAANGERDQADHVGPGRAGDDPDVPADGLQHDGGPVDGVVQG